MALEDVAGIYTAQGHINELRSNIKNSKDFTKESGIYTDWPVPSTAVAILFCYLANASGAIDAYTRALPLSEKASDTG